jgi:hypothetical protein
MFPIDNIGLYHLSKKSGDDMGIADRDYMRDRGKGNGINGPWRNGKLIIQPSPFSFLTKILFWVGIILLLTLGFQRLINAPSLSWKGIFPSKAPSIALPETGNVTLYQRGQSSPLVAKFTVIANSTSPESHHLVKLIDESTNESVLSVFVRNGETAAVKVPLGAYKINMAQGTRWHGETKMFGRDMLVTQGHTPLVFSASLNSVTGHILRLEGAIDGNYPTRPLSTDQF